MRRRARIDANQPDIVDALRKAGASVRSLSQLGQGIPDLLIGYCGWNALAEIKDPSQPRAGQSLSKHPDEKKFHDLWKGQVKVIKTVTEALALLEEMEHWGDW